MLELDHGSIKYITHNIMFCYSHTPMETTTYTRYNEIASLLEFENNPFSDFQLKAQPEWKWNWN